MSLAVVDACVVAKWLLPDEGECPGATALRDDLLGDRVTLLAPPVLEHEITGLLWKAIRDGRLPAVDGMEAQIRASELKIIVSRGPRSLSDAMTLAVDLRHPPYDCSYLALALAMGCDLYTADRRFISAAAGKYPCVKDINEYSGST